jgi:hypothetical protein
MEERNSGRMKMRDRRSARSAPHARCRDMRNACMELGRVNFHPRSSGEWKVR